MKAVLQLVTAPAALVLSTAEVKAQARIDHDDDDDFIDALIDAAIAHVDGRDGCLGRALVSQTWDLKLDCFPCGSEPIEIPLPPLRSIDSITYVDAEGATQTLSSGNYRTLSGGFGRSSVEPVYATTWPSTRNQRQAVTIRFTAGYVDGSDSPFLNSEIPAAIRQAMLLMIAHWYEHREAVVAGETMRELPMAVDALLNAYKVAWCQ